MRGVRRLVLAVLLAVAPGLARAADLEVGDAARGEGLFERACANCHGSEADRNGVGPSLFGILGRRAGTVHGFTYTPAMRASGEKWESGSLDAYLRDPRGDVAGTRMICPGVPSRQDRADIIAYLATLE